MKRKTLGLDIGTNSIGWAWIDENTETVILGSHIFQEGVNIEKGTKEVSRNEGRQQKRTLRRGNFRYKLRRARLRHVLREHGLLPDEAWAKILSSKELYSLRVKALDDPLAPQELGLVLLHMNQYRGYNATRDELAGVEGVAGEGSMNTKEKKKSEYQQLVDDFDSGFISSGKRTVGEYFFTLFEGQNHFGKNGKPIDVPTERIRNWTGGSRIVLRKRYVEEFDHIISKQREYHPILDKTVESLSRYKREKIERGELEPIRLWQKIRDEIIYYQRRLKSARHMVLPCRYEKEQFLYTITSDDGIQTVESRERGLACAPISHPYFQEFRIWKQLHNLRLKDATGGGTERYLVPDDDSGKLNEAGLKKLATYLNDHEEMGAREIKKELGILQFKIDQHDDGSEEKSSKKLLGNKTRVRLREALSPGLYDQLTHEQRIRMWEWASTATSPEHLKRIVAKAAKKWALPELQKRLGALSNVVLEGDKYARLSAKACRKLLPYMKGEGDPAAIPVPQEDEGTFAQAIAHLKPYLPKGADPVPGEILDWKGCYLPEDAAVRLLYSHHSNSREHTAADRTLKDQLEPVDSRALRNPVVARSLAQSIKVINAILKDPRMGRPDVVRVEMARELGKPKATREQLYKENQERYKQRKQDIEALEKLGRENPTHRDISIYRAAQEAGVSFDLSQLETGQQTHSGRVKGKSKLLRYRLWKEAGECCVYSGQPISYADLYDTGKVDLDHIVPRSRGGSNAPSNLAICLRGKNSEKGDSLPYEVWGGNVSYWKDFRKRIIESKLSKAKKELILAEEIPAGFALGQLQDTGWVAKELLWRLRQVVRVVHASKGGITSQLRGAWMKQPNGLQLPPQPSKQPTAEKDRTNHLHHALDAAVIAAIPYELEQKLIRAAKNGQSYNWRKSEFETEIDAAKHLPWPSFKQDVNAALAVALVSHQKQGRLVTKKRNSYKYWRAYERGEKSTEETPRPPIRKSIAVRGALHEETYYGIRKDAKNKAFYTVRKTLDQNFTEGQLNSIVDAQVKKAVLRHIETHGGEGTDIKKKLKSALHPDVLKEHPIYLPNHKAQKRLAKQGLPPEAAPRAQVKAVRIRVESSSMQPLYPGQENTPYVEPGSNYLFGLYRGKQLKRKGKQEVEEIVSKGEMISFFEAVQRKVAGIPLLPEQLDGLPLQYTLQNGDLVIPYEATEDPHAVLQLPQAELAKRLYKLRTMSITPNIYLVFEHHTVANGAELTRSKGDTHIAISFKIAKPRNILRIRNYDSISVIPVRLNPVGQIVAHRTPRL